jgi:hypothetical protein
MHVVAHQAETVDFEVEAGCGLDQEFEVADSITPVEEQIGAVVPPVRDVVDGAVEVNAGSSGHVGRIGSVWIRFNGSVRSGFPCGAKTGRGGETPRFWPGPNFTVLRGSGRVGCNRWGGPGI